MTTPGFTLPTFTNGTVPSSFDFLALMTNVRDLYAFGQGGVRTHRPLAVVAVAVENTELPNGSDLVIPWDVELVDTDNMWSGFQATTLLVNTPGIYRVGVSVNLEPVSAPAAATVAARITNGADLGGTSVAVGYGSYITGNGGSAYCSTVLPCPTGTELRAWAIQDTGVTVALDPQFGGCRFWAVWLGPLP